MSAAAEARAALERLRGEWEAHWEEALAGWSRFTKLSPPRWCLTAQDEKRERLASSFAMIRLDDHAVVIGLRLIQQEGLERFAREILAHEVGHHVYAPGDLRDHARLLARIRRALPTREGFAGLVANLYTDLLINDRLQRGAGFDMAGVFRALRKGKADRLWALYLHIYETLWRLPPNSLFDAELDERLRCDAGLGARLIRAYAKDWLRGAGRFGALLLPYLLEMPQEARCPAVWLDAEACGAGDVIPDGLVEVEEDEQGGALHPAEDPELNGLGAEESEAADASAAEPSAEGVERVGGRKNRYREPSQYVELMKSLGVRVRENELVIRYYRERALPHLVPFPARLARQAADPLPEGFDVWDVGSPLASVDWPGTLAASPHVIPGVTTLERTYGTTEGGEPKRLPLDLYVGIDCSGSMRNPAVSLSYPVLAGAVVALSALRSGAKVMACLSGEPGKHTETSGFVRSEREILGVMTGYLGTGYAFGIERLRETFVEGPALTRPTHILVVSDGDFFHMLKNVRTGWEIAQEAARKAGGGATAVLQADRSAWAADFGRLESVGWKVHPVGDLEELVAFARAFAKARYGKPDEEAAA